MKKVLVILIILIIPFYSIGQSITKSLVEIKLGKPYKEKYGYEETYIGFQDFFLFFKVLNNKVKIQKIDKESLDVISIKSINDFPKDSQIEQIGVYGGKCIVFYSFWDDSRQIEQLFTRELNIQTLQFINNGKVLIESKGKLMGTTSMIAPYKFGVVDKYVFKESKNKKNLLIYYRKKPDSRNDAVSKEVFGFNVFDMKLNNIWSQESRMPYTEKKMDTIGFFIPNDSSAYVFIRHYKDNSHRIKKSSKGVNFNFKMLQLTKNSKNFTVIDIPLDMSKNTYNTIGIDQFDDEGFIAGGFYSSKSLSTTNGIYCFKVNLKGKLVFNKQYDFTLELLNKYVKEKTISKNNKMGEGVAGVDFLKLSKVLYNDDKTFSIIGEAIEFKSVKKNDSFQYVDKSYYYDIYITKISGEGQLFYQQKIPKFQYISNNRLMWDDVSFVHFYGNGNDYFFFVDNPGNKDILLNEKPRVFYTGKPGSLIAYVLGSKSGKLSRMTLINSRKANDKFVYRFVPENSFAISSYEFGMEIINKNKKQFYPMKFTFNLDLINKN